MKILILAALLVGAAFGQLRFSAGSFYGDVSAMTPSNYTLLGSIPAGAILTSVIVGQSVVLTNEVAFTNSYQIGIVSKTNNFVIATQCPAVGSISIPTTVSNSFAVISSTKSTPVYAYITRVGAALGATGTYRIVINYIQK